MSGNPPPRRSTTSAQSGARSLLAQVRAEEALIEQRKQNIRRFGAGWLKPPGVGKTYQQMMDEEAERKEQAEIARREALMNELAAAEQSQVMMGADGAGEGVGEGMEERDLDADVPDADAEADEEDEDEAEREVTFNEESLLEGSEEDMLSQHMMRLEEAELDGTLQDERELGLDRDLDDDVPDAGSWEHTDTEEEIDSTDHDIQSAARAIRTGSPLFRPSARPSMARRSLGDDPDLGSSSFVNDSPVVSRAPRRGNAWSQRGGRGRGLGS